ncbi:MAG: hypothetical protein D6E12_01915 [Desulfovibrio sp.]|nr:MAG: hypothetical protein D6E12_01915 [Desulfovibrio sp.]
MLEPKVIPADPVLRKRVLIILMILSVLAGALLCLVLQRLQAIESLLNQDLALALAQLDFLLLALGIFVACSSLLATFYFLRLGLHILQAGQFPPPGMKVVRDTVVRSGGYARALGVASITLAALLLLTNVFWWWMRNSLLKHILAQ